MSDSNRRQRPLASEHLHRILTVQEWAKINSLGLRSAKRIIAAGDGPKITQLSTRRVGIREDHAVEWQNARVRERA